MTVPDTLAHVSADLTGVGSGPLRDAGLLCGLLIAVGYIAIVIGMASWTLARRSRWLSVYNIDLAQALIPQHIKSLARLVR